MFASQPAAEATEGARAGTRAQTKESGSVWNESGRMGDLDRELCHSFGSGVRPIFGRALDHFDRSILLRCIFLLACVGDPAPTKHNAPEGLLQGVAHRWARPERSEGPLESRVASFAFRFDRLRSGLDPSNVGILAVGARALRCAFLSALNPFVGLVLLTIGPVDFPCAFRD